MKTSIFKRSMALLLAFLLCVTTFVGSAVTPAFAAGTESEVVLIGFPRDGDDMYHTGNWGNEAMALMHGWAVLRTRQTIVRSVGSYYGPICYCLEPGVPLNSGDRLTDRDET